MNNEELIKWVEFVTDKFDSNHRPWQYSRDLGDLEHIRYKGDYTGYNHWTKRFRRYLKWITVKHFKPQGFILQLEGQKSLWGRIRRWPGAVASWWCVGMRLDSNLPDGQVNGIPTNWEEDGEYITMFCPYVGREVLAFLKAEPGNEYAKKILKAMHETAELSWPSEEETE